MTSGVAHAPLAQIDTPLLAVALSQGSTVPASLADLDRASGGVVTRAITSGDFKGLRHLADQTGRRFLRGILLYTGSTSVAFESNLRAMPVSALWQLEAKVTRRPTWTSTSTPFRRRR